MVRGGKLRRRYRDEHLLVSVISNLSSQHEQKAAVRQKVKRGPTNVPSTLHIMHECQCLYTRFSTLSSLPVTILKCWAFYCKLSSEAKIWRQRSARERTSRQAMSLTRQKILKIPPPDGVGGDGDDVRTATQTRPVWDGTIHK